MGTTSTPEQTAWLEAHVTRDGSPFAEEAARRPPDERVVDRDAWEDDDLSWAKAQVEDGRAAVMRGDVVTLDEHRARTAALLANLRV